MPGDFHTAHLAQLSRWYPVNVDVVSVYELRNVVCFGDGMLIVIMVSTLLSSLSEIAAVLELCGCGRP